MSFLMLPDGIPNFSKAVISLWFRVPKESITAAHAEEYSGFVAAPPLLRCVPLFTFGQKHMGRGLGAIQGLVSTGGSHIADTIGFSQVIPEYQLTPCCIAINCFEDVPRLQFNLQMDTVASGTNVYLSHTVHSISDIDDGDAYAELVTGPGRVPGSGVTSHSETRHGDGFDYFEAYADTNTVIDMSAGYMSEQPEFFYVQTQKAIEPDRWHHLLLSFDVSRPVSTQGAPFDPSGTTGGWNNVAQGVSSYCELWYAIDDVDYRGPSLENPNQHNLGPYSVDYMLGSDEFSGASPNGILTAMGFHVANLGSGYYYNVLVAAPTYNFSPQPIHAAGAEVGLPASALYVDHIYRVEMAEFQMWIGGLIDTGDAAIRRLFIDQNGDPVDPEKAKEALGQPAVMLHGNSNWQVGANTGALGVVEAIKTNQFVPTGQINKFVPEPSLQASLTVPHTLP